MKKILHNLATAAIISTGFISIYSLAGSDYQPAGFGFSGKQLATAITNTKRIEITNVNTVLYCQSEINTQGKALNTTCYDKNGDNELVSFTEKQLGQRNFTTARVDGQVVPVRMSYRVGYYRNNNKLDALLIPNLGSAQAQYGMHYTAPQERLDLSNWQEKYTQKSWANGQTFLGDGPLSRVAASVNTKGKTKQVRTLEAQHGYKGDLNIVKNSLKQSRFIPATVNGEAISMDYLAVVSYGEKASSLSLR